MCRMRCENHYRRETFKWCDKVMRIFYTDGSASPNPGPGGFAVIENSRPVALGSEDGETTNIRMEGFALVAAMRLAAGEPCEIHTDSEFWINVLTKWAPGWEEKGWRKKMARSKTLSLCSRRTNYIARCSLSSYGCAGMSDMNKMNEQMSGQIRRVRACGYRWR